LLLCNETIYGQTKPIAFQEISEDFKIILIVYSYPTPITTKVNLTNRQIKLIHSTPKDTVTFSTILEPSTAFEKLSAINFKRLKRSYSNPCIDDGLGLDLTIEKERRKKHISLDNYYQSEIGQIIEFINAHIPSKHKIWYDKEALTKNYVRCMSK
jgi:hypothetical protein